MKIMKASAGSGKTYRLAKTYLDLLLKSDDVHAYRHILAVTFTNKATAEMKGRILKELSTMAKTDEKARAILTDLLHDYGAFAVSTIDKFFQQALKAFSREIGRLASYQIELDKDSLVAEAMDRILDGLTEEKKDLVRWIKASVREQVEQGQKPNLESALHETGKLLMSDEHRELSEKYGMDDKEAFRKERLMSIRKDCRKIIDDFSQKAAAAGVKVKPGERISMPGKRSLQASDTLKELFCDTPFDLYNTAWELNRLCFSLGLAGEFYNEFDALLKEKNIMCLDESNTLLKKIIDGSDAPFVYEKMGVRYDHFLLDEFQDTSHIQWDNFLPLLLESESKGGSNLIVGDVKQSIYRWRNSDWKLLGEEVQERFPDAEVEVLENNWRSAKRIVAFNNRFFKFAARNLEVSDIYSDVEQGVKCKEEQEGSVRVSFCDDQLALILESINDARSNGARWGDIAILARNRKDGSAIAEFLVANDIPVISDDSLSLRSSLTVRRLTSLLSCMEKPDDAISRFLADSLEVQVPESYHSLVDLCESLLRSLRDHDPDCFRAETLFIQAFMDDLQSWTGMNGNNLRHFLKHWEESDLYIGSPDDDASVRILTIHKSKGLEFPYVIFPFAEKVGGFKPDVHWCHLATEGTKMPTSAEGIYPVQLSSTSQRTFFLEDYDKERKMQVIDNLNVLYVAMTRASMGLHVIARCPSDTCLKSFGRGAAMFGNLSELLFIHMGANYESMFGSLCNFNLVHREAENQVSEFPARYESIPLDGRLQPSEDAVDFFDESGAAGIDASPRRRGIVLHEILSRVLVPEDLPRAVKFARSCGKLDERQAADALDLLSGAIARHPAWFSSENVRNEVSLISTDGSEKRPDRVVLAPDSLTVIDYKFGEEREKDLWQVRTYCKLYRQMGYRNVAGYVWYVPSDKVVTASAPATPLP